MPVILPEDGTWSDTFIHPEHKSTSKIFTLYRPKIYYFEIIDCNVSKFAKIIQYQTTSFYNKMLLKQLG